MNERRIITKISGDNKNDSPLLGSSDSSLFVSLFVFIKMRTDSGMDAHEHTEHPEQRFIQSCADHVTDYKPHLRH